MSKGWVTTKNHNPSYFRRLGSNTLRVVRNSTASTRRLKTPVYFGSRQAKFAASLVLPTPFQTATWG